LLARVRAIIRRGHNRASKTIVIGDLEIDMAAKSIQRAGKPLR